ncbi:SDR family NAD(P)-dependent oxidoreductase [Gordonia sp. VNK21]|uniref:SDR family NAD(P)-dependent oxidoreductase n=1 Tax=Gordonia sp. VNK21 TaxID=3382483 RepID=UPI0038D45726
MASDLSGQRIVITGGSTGIGFEAARAAVAAGARVFITGLPPVDDVRQAAARISDDPTVVGYAAMDSSKPESVIAAAQAAEEFLGVIDVLVNNAGVSSQSLVVDHVVDRAEAEMRINYFGTFRMTQAILPAMLERGSGTIVNVASTLANVPAPTQANYGATKAAIKAFSGALRSEVERSGLNVTVFYPGLTRTAMTSSLNVRSPGLLDPEAVAKHLVKAIEDHPAHYTTGLLYRSLGLLGRIAPETSRRLLKRYY